MRIFAFALTAAPGLAPLVVRGVVVAVAATILLPFSFPRSAAGDETLTILPEKVALSSTESRQRLIIQRTADGQLGSEVREGVTWQSSDPAVVRVEGGVAVPLSDGNAVITAAVGDSTAAAEVSVTGQSAPFQWSFRNHVESVLSKSGCNSGACHGARAGQKGFRLTLFGYDLQADHAYLTRQARGRRIVLEDPGRSLILTKPTGLIPHKGGVRFDVASLEYRVLSEWIAGGAVGSQVDDPVIERLEVLPHHSRQTPGGTQQLVVMATFSDGHVEDVTRWAKYSSVDTNVLAVDDYGKVNVTGPGEGAIKVWYLNLNQMAFLSVPYSTSVSPDVFAEASPNNFIDELVLSKLAALNIPPSPLSDDATFIRRAFLDTIGVLPTTDEARRFLADTSATKRTELVEKLLARAEFVDYWSYKWSDLLLVSGDRLRPKALEAYYGWIRDKVARNVPWDQTVRELVTASGSTYENGASNFYALHQTPEEMAETVSQAFLGLSINCAKCHNHPLEKWTNDQYYGMANLFSRVRAKGWGGDFRGGDGLRVVFPDTQGELIQPGTGRPQPPRPLDAEPVDFDATLDRRVVLAEWLTARENPYFTRSIVNRIWANFFGVGLVEKVDDMRITNPASNEELLDAAATFLAQHNYDLKELMRAILNSAAYQRSSKPLPGNEPDQRFYSHYYPRRLPAEVLLDALSQATGVPSQFKDQPAGTRALQLSDSSIESYFLSTFGRPERIITCDCERTEEPSMTQVLHIYNGNTLNGKLQASDNRITQLLASKTPAECLLEEIYLSALSRFPTPAETQQLLPYLNQIEPADKRALVEDLYWSILSSREFLFNH